MEVGLEPTRITVTNWALGAVFIAGSVGVGMALAGVHSAVRIVLILLFLAVAPTVAIARLLTSFDPFARLILACTTNLVLLSLIGLTMLAVGGWSPLGLVFATAAIVAACSVLQVPRVRHGIVARAASWKRSLPGDRWAFDRRLDHGVNVPSAPLVDVDRGGAGTNGKTSRT